MSNGTDRTCLAIDYGERRIGLARSDPTGTIASSLDTLEVRSIKDALARLADVIAEHRPDCVVIGYPLHSSGEKSDKCRQIDRFADKLAAIYNGPIYKVDERYSTEEAVDIIHAHGKKVGQDKKRLDRLAAVIILQRFLDERS